MQTSQATGAAAAQVGPEALSLAGRLHYELVLSMCKTAAVLHEVCGISITRGGVAQALGRLGERCAPSQQLKNPVTILADLLRVPGSVAPLALPAPAAPG